MYKYCTNVLQILYNCWVVTARQLSLLRIHLSPKYIQLARSTKPINNSKYIQYIYCNCNCELWKLISAVIWIKFNQRETQFHDYSNMDLGLKVWTCHYWMKTCFNCHHLFCFRPIKTGVQLQTHKNVWSTGLQSWTTFQNQKAPLSCPPQSCLQCAIYNCSYCSQKNVMRWEN